MLQTTLAVESFMRLDSLQAISKAVPNDPPGHADRALDYDYIFFLHIEMRFFESISSSTFVASDETRAELNAICPQPKILCCFFSGDDSACSNDRQVRRFPDLLENLLERTKCAKM